MINAPYLFTLFVFLDALSLCSMHLVTDTLTERAQQHHLRLPSSDLLAVSAPRPMINESVVLPDLNVKIPYKVSAHFRHKFIAKDRHDIWQGSHTVEIPLALLAFLSKVQYASNVKGTIGEIGVHGGLFFIGLAHLSFANDNLWACDVFDQQHKNVDGSGFGNYDYFIKKCQHNGIDGKSVKVFVGSSAELETGFTTKQNLQPFRIISVDGGHTRELTFNDLTVAASNLARGGIIVLDDVFNFEWPGVIDGLFSWLNMYPDEFGPFFVGHNKVFLAHKDYHGLYFAALRHHPFWSLHLTSDPSTNHNIHKAKASGQNVYAWAGFPYLNLAAAASPNITAVVDVWMREMDAIGATAGK